MWTLTNPAPYASATRSSLASRSSERSRGSGSGPARLMRYGACTASGATPSSAKRSRNAGSSLGRAARRRHVAGLSVNTWSADAPISAARFAAQTMPLPSARWAPSGAPFGSIVGSVAERHGP